MKKDNTLVGIQMGIGPNNIGFVNLVHRTGMPCLA